MKNLILSLFATTFVFLNFSFSQESVNDDFRKHELGIDATYILKTVVNLNNYIPYNYPDTSFILSTTNTFNTVNSYIINYNFYFNQKWGMRSGIGFKIYDKSNTDNSNSSVTSSYNYPVSSNASSYLFTGTHVIKGKTIDARIGIQNIHIISNKWEWFWGLDFVYKYNDFIYNISEEYKTTSGSFQFQKEIYERNTKVNSFGCGPSMGIKFNLSKRVSLSTETNIYFFNSKGKNKYKMEDIQQSSGSSSNYTFSRVTSGEKEIIGNDLNINIPLFFYLSFRL